MGSFSETLTETLAKIAEWLGLKPSEAKRLDLMEQKLQSARRENTDQLEDLKGRIKSLERQALAQKAELEKAKGTSRRLVVSQIEQTFRDLDRLQGRENIVVQTLDRISLAITKVGEARAAKQQGVSEDQMDELAVELQDVFADLKVSDRAARDLERVEYSPPQRAQVDVEDRLGQFEGTAKQAAELPATIQQRLKELESE